MHESAIINNIIVVIFLLFAASVSAIIMQKIKFPYTIGLLIVGIIVGILSQQIDFFAPMKEVRLTPEIILFLILPTLLFEASINIDPKLLFKNLLSVLTLATIGLLTSMIIIGCSLSLLTPIPIATALLFGALISATDPVAVIALFKELGVPERLSTLVDGESLFNDATAIVVFHILLTIILSNSGLSTDIVLSGIRSFFIVFFGGIAVGLALAAIFTGLIFISKNDPFVRTTLTTVLAYMAYIVADHILHVSGVMAVVAAGIFISWASNKMHFETSLGYTREHWEFMAFIANSLIFLLMGLTEYHLFEDLSHYHKAWKYILLAFFLTIIARTITIYSLTPLTNLLSPKHKIQSSHKAIMVWGGLRGAIPLALALGLPLDFPHRTIIIDLTLGTVLISLLFQGTTVNSLLKKLKVI